MAQVAGLELDPRVAMIQTWVFVVTVFDLRTSKVGATACTHAARATISRNSPASSLMGFPFMLLVRAAFSIRTGRSLSLTP